MIRLVLALAVLLTSANVQREQESHRGTLDGTTVGLQLTASITSVLRRSSAESRFPETLRLLAVP
jgi:hypothetical protein